MKCVIYPTGEGTLYICTSANPNKEKVLAINKYQNRADLPPARFDLHPITLGNKSSLLLEK